MKTFAALLDTLATASPDQRPAIEQLIRDAYERHKAVLALDMSGFTLSVRRDGILSYLCQIRRMQKLTLPIVLAHKGELVKFEADNLLAVFDDSAQAVEAALAMLAAAAAPADGGPALAFSIGIDCGKILLLDAVDCFGDAVNLSHKLGEDIAQPCELLITNNIREKLGDPPVIPLEEMPLSVSGVELTAYRVAIPAL